MLFDRLGSRQRLSMQVRSGTLCSECDNCKELFIIDLKYPPAPAPSSSPQLAPLADVERASTAAAATPACDKRA